MIEALAQVLTDPDTAFLAGVVLVAGVVRGFSGFGTGMVVVPLASWVLAPLEVLTMIMVMDVVSAAPLWARVQKDANFKEMMCLVIGLAICLPIGLYLLSFIDPDIFRLQASVVALVVVAIMASGWRHSMVMGSKLLVTIGGLGGFLGGLTGIPGPPVILAYMTGQSGAARVRANIFLFLLAFDCLLGALLFFKGAFTAPLLLLTAVVLVPFTLGSMLGARIFNPSYEKLYRWVAYVIIAASAIISMPIWG